MTAAVPHLTVPERVLTQAERDDEAAKLARARVTGAVRKRTCPVCEARPYGPCQVTPPGDHFGRWLAAFRAGAISRAEFTDVVVALVVITDNQLITAGAR